MNLDKFDSRESRKFTTAECALFMTSSYQYSRGRPKYQHKIMRYAHARNPHWKELLSGIDASQVKSAVASTLEEKINKGHHKKITSYAVAHSADVEWRAFCRESAARPHLMDKYIQRVVEACLDTDFSHMIKYISNNEWEFVPGARSYLYEYAVRTDVPFTQPCHPAIKQLFTDAREYINSRGVGRWTHQRDKWEHIRKYYEQPGYKNLKHRSWSP